jgi:hypothetical protein
MSELHEPKHQASKVFKYRLILNSATTPYVAGYVVPHVEGGSEVSPTATAAIEFCWHRRAIAKTYLAIDRCRVRITPIATFFAALQQATRWARKRH